MSTNFPNIKQLNRNRVFRLIAQSDRLAKQDIAAQLSMSLPTVTQNLNELKSLGLIEENGYFVSGIGRRARAISLIPTSHVGLGLDLTQNHFALVMVDLKGRILKSIRKRLPTANTPEYYRTLSQETEEFIRSAQIPRENILGMGISIPGIVVKNGTVIENSNLLKIDHNFYEIYRQYTDLPYILLNDASASGSAEFHYSTPDSEMVYLFLGNSVGGAVLLNHTMYQGINCRSGEFGHMTLVPGGLRCHCGKTGCADAYCSASVLARYAEDNLELFFKRLENGDPYLSSVFETYLKNLAILINNIRVCLDCDIVIGGYVGAYIGKYLDHLKELVRERLTFAPEDVDFIKPCTLKLESSAVGGALHYINEFVKTI